MRISHVNWNDQTIEGLVYTDHPSFTVQFHPEAHTAAGDTTMRKFFVHLVREAAREMSGSPAGRKR